MKVFRLIALSATLFAYNTSAHSQLNYEIGTEITAASFSTFGGTAGGGLKFAITTDEGLVFGPSFRYQYFWSKNNSTGQAGSGSIYGGGVFLHYRFMDWFFVGTEIEILNNPFGGTNRKGEQEKWTPTIFLGLGMSKEFPVNDYPIRINLGVFYDLYDGIRETLRGPDTHALYNQSPLRNNYFIRLKDPVNPAANQGRYLPFIYRIAFFFPLTRN